MTLDLYIKNALKEFNVTDAAIAELQIKYSDLKINGLEDKQGYATIKSARMDIKARRVEVEKKRKELNETALSHQRAVNYEARRITALLEPIEEYLESKEKEFDAEKERIKKEKECLTQEIFSKRSRMLLDVGMHFDGFQYLGNYDFPGSGHSSLNILNVMVSIDELKNDSDEEFNETYADCYLKHEAKQSYLAEEKLKQDELQAKLEAERLESQRKEAEERRIENERFEKIRLEQKAERERLDVIAHEQAQKEVDLWAEKQRIEAEKQAIIQAEAAKIKAEQYAITQSFICTHKNVNPLNCDLAEPEFTEVEESKPVEIDTFENVLKVVETNKKLDEYLKCYSIEIFRGNKLLQKVYASDCLSECSEDATLGRDLNCIFNVIDFVSIAYEAGKDGEEIIFERKYLNEEDDEITQEKFYK